jgi:hypothetical protein
MDETVYVWDNVGQYCFREDLEKFIAAFGDDYTAMTVDEFYDSFDQMQWELPEEWESY